MLNGAGKQNLPLSVAIGHRYDSLYLRNGIVKIKGFDVEYATSSQRSVAIEAEYKERYLAPSPMFTSIATETPYDVGELPLSTYLQSVDLGKEVIAIPVFPSRIFPHNLVNVNFNSTIRDPADLVGKRFGTGFFSKNYSVWLRGILRHQYDIPIEKIIWVEDQSEHFPGYRPPRRYTIERVKSDRKLAALLEAGEIDALVAPRGSQQETSENARPLFENPYSEIARYFVNRIFPINTVITIPKMTLARKPAVAEAVFEAFQHAISLYLGDLRQGNRSDDHSGLSLKRLEEVGIPFPNYGFKTNRGSIKMMIQYCFEQGIIAKNFEAEDLFLLTDT
jgi:4,5-dihydroxyphthalate decarboxylase